MANTFRKLQKRIENKDGSYTYEPLSYVGIDDIPLDIMRGAGKIEDGEIGLVPKPTKGQEDYYLKGNGQWTPLNSSSSTSAGLMSTEDKKKLDGIENGANKYVHPTTTAYESGLYKITTNNLGHIISATLVTKDDITSLGIPGQDTTYALASTANNGLMSASDKSDIASLKSSLDQTQKTIINNLNGTEARITETQANIEKLHVYVDNQIEAINKKITKINDKIAKYHS